MLIINILLLMMAALILSSTLSTKAHAHGYVESPPARVYIASRLPYSQGSALVGGARNEPQSMAALLSGVWPNDGQLASVNCRFGCLADRQTSTMWTKTDIPVGPNTFTWFYTAPHATREWQFFITRRDWDPNAPLTRAQFNPTPLTVEQGYGQYFRPRSSHQVIIPSDYSGYHIIYAVWTRSDSAETFYNVIDVNIVPSDGGTPPPPPVTPPPPPVTPPPPPVTPPPPPSGVTLNPPMNLQVINETQSSITLAWNASGNVVNTNYEIYRNGVIIAEVPGNTLTFTDNGLAPGTTHTYTVRATAVSEHSNTVMGTTSQTPPPVTPPPPPPVTPTGGLTYQISGEGSARQHITVTNRTSAGIPSGWRLQFNFTGGNPTLEWPAFWAQGSGGNASTTVNGALNVNGSVTIPMSVSANTRVYNLSVNNMPATRE